MTFTVPYQATRKYLQTRNHQLNTVIGQTRKESLRSSLSTRNLFHEDAVHALVPSISAGGHDGRHSRGGPRLSMAPLYSPCSSRADDARSWPASPPCRQGVHPWLDVRITGCRGGDMLCGAPWPCRAPRLGGSSGGRPMACSRPCPPPRDRRGTRDAAVAVRRRRWLLCPLAQAAVRAWPVAARVRASPSTVSQPRPA